MKTTSKLKIGDRIIALENITIPSTGTTWYIYKGKTYKIIEDLPLWKENAWKIIFKNGGFENTFYLSERNILKNFDCVRFQRKEKLKEIQRLKKL